MCIESSDAPRNSAYVGLCLVPSIDVAAALPRVLPCPVTQMTPIVQCSELFINELEVPPHTVSAKSFVFLWIFMRLIIDTGRRL